MTTRLQRLFDLACAAAGLVLLAPVFACVAMMVLCDDGRPIFFSQVRVGRNGNPFRIWKFRTMAAGRSGNAVTSAGDPRVTRLGAFLRRYKLDELPQLINVLRGDMGIAGPRPEVPEYVDLKEPLWCEVLSVRPGITDLATLVYRNEEGLLGESSDPITFYRERVLPAKLRLSARYLRSKSFVVDLKLILLSIRSSLSGRDPDPRLIGRIISSEG